MSRTKEDRRIVCEAAPAELLAVVDRHRKRLLMRSWVLVLTQPVASLIWLAATISFFFVDSVLGFISLVGGGALCVAISDQASQRMNDRRVDDEKLEKIQAILTALGEKSSKEEDVWMEAELFSHHETEPIKGGVRWAYEHKWFSARWQMEGGRSVEFYLTQCAKPGETVADKYKLSSELQVVLRSEQGALRPNAIVCPEGWLLSDRKIEAATQVFDFVCEGEAAADSLLAVFLTTIDSQEAWEARL